jgi:hypothetical protein
MLAGRRCCKLSGGRLSGAGMLLVIEGRASNGRRIRSEVGEFATKQLRSCDVAKMTITKDV